MIKNYLNIKMRLTLIIILMGVSIVVLFNRQSNKANQYRDVSVESATLSTENTPIEKSTAPITNEVVKEMNVAAIQNPAMQRCLYNGQSYIPGDILKTEQGWIRCTPTIIFSSDNTGVRQAGSPAWVSVQ